MIFVTHIWISLLISAPKYQREAWYSNVLRHEVKIRNCVNEDFPRKNDTSVISMYQLA